LNLTLVQYISVTTYNSMIVPILLALLLKQ